MGALENITERIRKDAQEKVKKRIAEANKEAQEIINKANKELEKDKNKILFLAPTKPLVTQHAQFLKKFLTIEEDSIVIFTGEITPEKRQKMWKKSRRLLVPSC